MEIRQQSKISIRRLAKAISEPVSTVGRWVQAPKVSEQTSKPRRCPVSGDPQLRAKVRALCEEDRHRTFGHRMIRALLARRYGIHVNRKTVCRIMREEGLARPKIWHRPKRPKRVEKMHPKQANQGWQIDMTSFQLSDLTTMFLVVVIDCCTRQIVGWTLDRRCRASEWISALRLALDYAGLATKKLCNMLTLRSDNGSQPCAKRFVEFLGSRGVKGQYTGYNAPDDNAFVERVIRTIKEEEIWCNLFDTVTEAHQAIEEYVNYYNAQRLHSALNYQTPNEYAAAQITHVAA
ncbi:IS3 family transposase [Planctomycetota bacterium]